MRLHFHSEGSPFAVNFRGMGREPMTTDDLAELEAARCVSQSVAAAWSGAHGTGPCPTNLETALVRRAGDLIEGTKLANALAVLEITEAAICQVGGLDMKCPHCGRRVYEDGAVNVRVVRRGGRREWVSELLTFGGRIPDELVLPV